MSSSADVQIIITRAEALLARELDPRTELPPGNQNSFCANGTKFWMKALDFPDKFKVYLLPIEWQLARD
jgi:hypothetical protein